ncbi:nuclear transport factor 2 family protein [Roseovarius pelagicus]|uniref:SnoaL-like domain-containing protein n=1 Tax=Roseovarius pelagicus TaxID=2980108 RepID=A0ABY6DC34_9RHOB|nr:hypothetical protein [Roseovarius pelagicus]UXX82573.1 hypothetical protein N7U68_15945 [Roseovarius pelagicus]
MVSAGVLYSRRDPAGDRSALSGGLEYAGTEIFRLDNAGRIVEHWDALQEVPETSANTNGMF